jgi:hypothetical protein
MTINRTGFGLPAGFWILILASQYYFLYAKFNSLNVCRETHQQVDVTQAQLDKAKARIDGLKK